MNLEEKIKFIVEKIEEKKGIDILVVDAPEKQLIDKFVICSGSSDPHIKTIYENLRVSLKDNNVHIYNIEQNFNLAAGWLVIDTGDVVVHIMSEEKREYYELEDLWSEYIGK
ncbi:MAG: ribosome silencing factor [Candidatus Muiribacteriota bacterium]|jgi:ribosome-associated protein